MRKINNLNNLNSLGGGSRREASLMLIKYCPLCNKDYAVENMLILQEESNSFLAHLSCNYCGSHLIIRVMVSQQGLVGTASITDLVSGEVLPLNNERAVSADEIIDLAELIKNNNLINNLIL